MPRNRCRARAPPAVRAQGAARPPHTWNRGRGRWPSGPPQECAHVRERFPGRRFGGAQTCASRRLHRRQDQPPGPRCGSRGAPAKNVSTKQRDSSNLVAATNCHRARISAALARRAIGATESLAHHTRALQRRCTAAADRRGHPRVHSFCLRLRMGRPLTTPANGDTPALGASMWAVTRRTRGKHTATRCRTSPLGPCACAAAATPPWSAAKANAQLALVRNL